MFSNGTPPPCPPNHMRESWLLLRLSPITQTSPCLAKIRALVLREHAGRSIVERLAVLAAVARVQPGLVIATLVWAVVVVALGLTQERLLPGPAHWVIQVIHLLVGMAAIGLSEALGRRIQGRLSNPALAK